MFPAPLRREVLSFPREDGGVDLWDPLLDRRHALSPEEATALAEGAGVPWLAAALLLEGPAADALRRQLYLARQNAWVFAPTEEPEEAFGEASGFAAAAALPEEVAPRWRDPEVWRRAAASGQASPAGLVRLEGLFTPQAVAAWRAALAAASWERLETATVRGARAVPAASVPPVVVPSAAVLSALRPLIGAALGRVLPERTHFNGWRFQPGDAMALHPDGPRYAATLAIGLNDGWTAAHGGAIAFGPPSEAGIVVTERWLPHAGDALAFAPHARSFHAVEPVRKGERWTVSGWWVAGG